MGSPDPAETHARAADPGAGVFPGLRVRAASLGCVGCEGYVDEVQLAADGRLGAWIVWTTKGGKPIKAAERATLAAYFVFAQLVFVPGSDHYPTGAAANDCDRNRAEAV